MATKNIKHCLHSKELEKLKLAIKSLGKKGGTELLKKTSIERLEFFSEALGTDATFLNTKFEKALAKKSVSAMKNFFKDLLDADKTIDKMSESNLRKNHDEFDVFIQQDGNLDDLIRDKLGLNLKPEELKEFKRLGEEFSKSTEKAGDDLWDIMGSVGNKNKTKRVIKAWMDLDEYKVKISANHNLWRSFLAVGKASLLASSSTAFLNIFSTAVISSSEHGVRRISNFLTNFKINMPNKKVVSYQKKYKSTVREIFKETGFDLSRASSLENSIFSKTKISGEKILRAKSTAALAYTDWIYSNILGKPDVMFASGAFADQAGIVATQLAETSKLSSVEIFKDATRLMPRTIDGLKARESAIYAAAYSTFTDKKKISQILLKLKLGFDEHVPGNLAELTAPFVVVPTNVAITSTDYAGLGLAKGISNFSKHYSNNEGKRKYSFENMTRDELEKNITDMVRGGMGPASVVILANLFWDDVEFVSRYDPSRRDVDEAQNVAYEAVCYGDKCFSLDYFGNYRVPFSIAFNSIKYGKDGFINALTSETTNIPVVGAVVSGVENVARTESSSNAFDTVSKGVGEFYSKAIVSRVGPNIIPVTGKATDEFKRDPKDPKFGFGGVNFSPVINRIPYVRKNLRVKTNIFGQDIKEGGAVATLLTGSRSKTTSKDKVINEMFRLTNRGFKPSLKNLEKSKSKDIVDIKSMLGEEKFYQMKNEFGQKVRSELEELIQQDWYKSFNNEDKKDAVNKNINKTYNSLKEFFQDDLEEWRESNHSEKNEFDTPEEVVSAVKKGQLTKDEATDILVNKFNFE